MGKLVVVACCLWSDAQMGGKTDRVVRLTEICRERSKETWSSGRGGQRKEGGEREGGREGGRERGELAAETLPSTATAYTGEFSKGLFEGQGRLQAQGAVAEGQFRDGDLIKGSFSVPAGHKFTGTVIPLSCECEMG